MRRTDLIKASGNIVKALHTSNIFNVLSPVNKKVDIQAILKAFQSYTMFYSQFNDIDKQLLSIMKLDGLNDPKLWSGILEGREEDRLSSNRYRAAIRFTVDQLPKIIELLKQDHIEYSSEGSNLPSKENIKDGFSIVTVILPELPLEVSKPNRLVKVLESIELLYQVCSILQGVEGSELSVAAIDSGSDKSFDFLGAAKLIESVKELILEMWDRIVYFKAKQADVRLDLIIKALPVMEKIAEMEAANAISPEQAELLKRDVANATGAFISAGAIIPEFTDHAALNPRKIMAPEPKLLTHQDLLANHEESLASDHSFNTDDDLDEEI